MDDHGVRAGAVMRRRQRRLRSWWRHEQQTVAEVLATVTHHSLSKVGTANDAPRGQRTVTAAHRGPDGRRSVASDFLRSCAADGGTVAPWCSLSS